MSERENLFRPIHKGIRLMVYELGSRMQTTNFGDVAEGNRFVTRLQHELNDSLSNCILCMLRFHSLHEERDIFTELRAHDPDPVEIVLKEHAEVARRSRGVIKTCQELVAASSTSRRLELGDRLNLEVNDLFTFYLAHLNNEETLLVPLMWQWFTDDQLRAMRAKFYDGLPQPLFETWMRWTLPSMNPEELVVLFSGLKKDPGRRPFGEWVRVAHMVLDFDRWLTLSERVGLPEPSLSSESTAAET
jgi:Hemerythrin HHE cation binding domain